VSSSEDHFPKNVVILSETKSPETLFALFLERNVAALLAGSSKSIEIAAVLVGYVNKLTYPGTILILLSEN
jgi:hypothetical protein